MRVLVIGSGGREHALAWRLLRGAGSTALADRELVVAPGNAGMTRDFARWSGGRARCAPLLGGGIDGVVASARAERAELVIIGPEQPLVDGVADALAAAGIPCFGPSKAAARLEGSKAFMKDVCATAGVAGAAYLAVTHVDEARRFIDERAQAGKGVVVKADGLCAGKGVVVCPGAAEALPVLEDMLGVGSKAPRFGDASRTVVLEDLLPGVELSVLAICDGHDAALFGAARDHKRLQDDDRGPNTGGMGAVGPLDERQGVPAALLAEVKQRIVLPVLAELRARGAPFRGLLFAGLMVDGDAVRVLEFNVRFGDPETEALLLALDVDLLPALQAVANGERLPPLDLIGTDKGAVVVVAARGYPDAPEQGAVIDGLERAEQVEGAQVFCAGVATDDAGRLTVAGGRVLVVGGRGRTFDQALDRAYRAADHIHIAGALLRRDIGNSVRGR
ncbi:MAG: phosphoribosylamine--glycine ligase [Deltaproteobacteria bacterium RBG_16_71_12]|nr:MAG: phosphoribosylamine--glycine ligase [Deltaproteobacteria bacterium RBG_16_71_12]